MVKVIFEDRVNIRDEYRLVRIFLMRDTATLLSRPGLTKPVGTGPVWPAGPARFRFGPISNRPKFKIQIWIQKNEKFPKFLKIL